MDGSCANLYRGPSTQSEEMKKVTFVNTRADLIWPAWINLAGFVSVVPEEIPPGGAFTTYSRVGQRWIMIDGSNWNCVQHFTIDGDSANYEINGGLIRSQLLQSPPPAGHFCAMA